MLSRLHDNKYIHIDIYIAIKQKYAKCIIAGELSNSIICNIIVEIVAGD